MDKRLVSRVQNLAHPVGAHQRGLRPLQLARQNVGLRLRRPGAACRDLVQQLLDLGLDDLGYQLLVSVRADQLVHDSVIVGRAARREVGRVLRQIPFDQITDPRRLPCRLALAEGIAALVDLAPQLHGPFPGGRRGPFRPALRIPRHLATCSTNMWPVIP
jgi:hypothetical protein